MIVVTGGAGFIGSAMVAQLNAQGESNLWIVDNLGTSEKWKNLRGKKYQEYLHKSDFLKLVQDDKLPKNIKAIVHLGACSSTTERNAEYMMQNNYLYTKALASWALAHKVRFVYASSAATYGDGENGFSDADDVSPTLKPLNVYGYSKQAFDLWVLQNQLQDKIAGLKFFNVFGPNEYHKGDMKSVVFKAHQQILENGKVCLFKSHRPDYRDGEQKRDFIYVKDCTAVMSWLLEHKNVNGIFNLGTGNARTWKDLVTAVFAALGRKPEIEYIDLPLELRDRYQYFTQATMQKLIETGCDLHFHPLEEAVKDYVQNYLELEHAHL